LVEKGIARRLAYSPGMFKTGKLASRPLPAEDIGFAGLRILAHVNDPERFDELVVFQGASYFRSLGSGQSYGLSARGLAIKTGELEEFPLFRAFWVEKPTASSDRITVYALLDSESVTGAYRFTIAVGTATVMDVEAVLFPRVTLAKFGLAPGTTMFFFSANGREGVDDYRPEVHDSDGLRIANGRGEHIWRPLANPRTLQVSAFVDESVRGFGLIQRDRDYATYQDYNAQYERRPNLWVEPIGAWGRGHVVLVEIPSQSEVNDNIVAYWQPETPIAAGSELRSSYRLSWGNGPGFDGAIVLSTRRGRGLLGGPSPVRRFVIDYVMSGVPQSEPKKWPEPAVTASAGKVKDVTVDKNPVTGGWRVTFSLDPEYASLVELRCDLTFEDRRPAEVWLYRWTA